MENQQQILEQGGRICQMYLVGFLSGSWRQQYGTLSLHAGPKQSFIHPQITTSGHA